MLINCLAVGAGGFLGSVGRYLLSAAFPPQNVSFPWITLLINFLGSFLIAAVSELSDNWLPLSPRLLLFLRWKGFIRVRIRFSQRSALPDGNCVGKTGDPFSARPFSFFLKKPKLPENCLRQFWFQPPKSTYISL